MVKECSMIAVSMWKFTKTSVRNSQLTTLCLSSSVDAFVSLNTSRSILMHTFDFQYGITTETIGMWRLGAQTHISIKSLSESPTKGRWQISSHSYLRVHSARQLGYWRNPWQLTVNYVSCHGNTNQYKLYRLPAYNGEQQNIRHATVTQQKEEYPVGM